MLILGLQYYKLMKSNKQFKNKRITLNPGNNATIKKNRPPYLNKSKRIKIYGLFLLLISTFILISLSSYIYNYHKYKFIDVDESLINTLSFDDFFVQNKSIIYNAMGLIGAKTAYFFLYNWFGIISYVLVGIIFMIGFRVLFKRNLLKLNLSAIILILVLFICIPAFFGFLNVYFNIPSYLSGYFGYQTNRWLNIAIGEAGTFLLYVFIASIIFILNTDINKLKLHLKNILDLIRHKSDTADKKLLPGPNIDSSNTQDANIYSVANHDSPIQKTAVETINKADNSNTPAKPINEVVNNGNVEMEINIPQAEKIVLDADFSNKIYDPCSDLNSYEAPSLELLNRGSENIEYNNRELDKNKHKIISSLKHYGIDIETIKATVGPTITLYEIIPGPGVRVSKIKSLEDDIALSLSALGIRIIAPMPGKGTVGIEVPNKQSQLVTMHSLLATEKYIKSKAELPIALGKTISNEVYIEDLAKMPHLLIAGATGQGKSVGINTVITSLIYKKHPSQLKFVLVDPKKVELSLFSKLEKHFLAKIPGEADPIITDTKKVIYTLNSLCTEMDQRYNLLTDAGVRHITEYNKKFVSKNLNPNKGHRYLPYIVLVIDEFADLILTAGKEIESSIVRLAQLARAVGIHLIIATQRPSVNVITGLIKANFPARVAFKVISKVDSRTILDSSGADRLIGKGDMLFSYGSTMVRLQCSYLSVEEVDDINSFIGLQQGYASAYELPEVIEGLSDDDSFFQDPSSEGRDPLFTEAARLVVINKNASTSSIQRKLQLGYNRAGRIMDQLEAAGIVGPQNGSKVRDLKIIDEYALEELFNRLNIK
ncbi:MAG: DNA translocase FtsK 4TM domain-containing protein [Solitalea-like symbiont of Tyrophagus putrescentiae]